MAMARFVLTASVTVPADAAAAVVAVAELVTIMEYDPTPTPLKSNVPAPAGTVMDWTTTPDLTRLRNTETPLVQSSPLSALPLWLAST